MKIVAGPTTWEKELKCRCGATLIAEESDVRIGFFGPSWGGETPEKKTFVECPICGEHITFDAPPRIQRLAEERSAAAQKGHT